MRISVSAALLGCCMLALSACGEKSGTPSGATPSKGMALPEISKTVAASAPDGRRIDPATIRNRSMAGRWVGKIGDDNVEVTFGGNETISIQVTSKGGLTDAATGKYSWNQDGTLSGTTSGGGERLSGFTKWSGTFAADMLKVSGSGATLDLIRYRSEPVANPVGVVDGRVYPGVRGGMMAPPAAPAMSRTAK